MSLVKTALKNLGCFCVGIFALITVWGVLRWMITGAPPWGDLTRLAVTMAFTLVFFAVLMWMGSHFTVLD